MAVMQQMCKQIHERQTVLVQLYGVVRERV